MDDEKLIEAVKGFPCLWRVSSRAYKDLRAKENAWKEIALLQEDYSPEECEKRWKQLRDKYVREKKKTKKGKSGDAGPKVVSCWPLFEVMDFLRETVRHKSTATNFPQSQSRSMTPLPSASRESGGSEESDLEESQFEATDRNSELTNIPSSPAPPSITPSRSSSSRSPSRPTKRRKKATDPVDELLISELKKTSQCDESSSFGDHVAARLRKFSAQQRARVCLEIDRVLYEIEFPVEPIPPQPRLFPNYSPHPSQLPHPSHTSQLPHPHSSHPISYSNNYDAQ